MFFAAYVKSLCILFDMPSEHMLRITSVCTGIDNLTTWFLPSQSQISAPALRRPRACGDPAAPNIRLARDHAPAPDRPLPIRGPVFSRVSTSTSPTSGGLVPVALGGAAPHADAHLARPLVPRRPAAERAHRRFRAAAPPRLPKNWVCALREVPRGLMSTALLLTERPEATIRGALVSALRCSDGWTRIAVFFCIPDPFQLRKAHCEWEDLKWRVLEQATKQRLVGDTSALAARDLVFITEDACGGYQPLLY
ncbi:unnamed protein product [Mycena citricolor]|uniref:Uncharacterized protein n=1 Tax=Mycena citricolor TaxID=2018698 RepID=A0AAD2K1P9_9AGAR|nr:unnamed protein product [Mycena citricolor]